MTPTVFARGGWGWGSWDPDGGRGGVAASLARLGGKLKGELMDLLRGLVSTVAAAAAAIVLGIESPSPVAAAVAVRAGIPGLLTPAPPHLECAGAGEADRLEVASMGEGANFGCFVVAVAVVVVVAVAVAVVAGVFLVRGGVAREILELLLLRLRLWLWLWPRVPARSAARTVESDEVDVVDSRTESRPAGSVRSMLLARLPARRRTTGGGRLGLEPTARCSGAVDGAGDCTSETTEAGVEAGGLKGDGVRLKGESV